MDRIQPERIVVLYGGVGAEREVSLQSGPALAGRPATFKRTLDPHRGQREADRLSRKPVERT